MQHIIDAIASACDDLERIAATLDSETCAEITAVRNRIHLAASPVAEGAQQ